MKPIESGVADRNGEDGVDPALLEEAGKICGKRFRFADRGHPAVEALLEMGLRWCAYDLATCADKFAVRKHIPEGADRDHDAVDPLDVLQEELTLPSLPQVVIELQQVINDSDSSASDVAAVVSKDAGISAFLLRLVNSAFYSFPSQIDTISRAVTVVGMKQLSNMALGVSVLKVFKGAKDSTLDLAHFWKHSIAVGIIAQRLAERARLPEPERYFVCGLLHDVGRVALYTVKPDKAAHILRVSRDKSIPLYAAEAEVVGFDHAKLGGMLLRKWNFPFSLTMGVLYHHLPEKSEKFKEPLIVHIADVMTKALGISSTDEWFVPPLSDDAWTRTGLTVADLYEVESGLRDMLDDMFSVLLH